MHVKVEDGDSVRRGEDDVIFYDGGRGKRIVMDAGLGK